MEIYKDIEIVGGIGMRFDKNIIYILGFLTVIILINTILIDPMREENRDLSLQIENINNNERLGGLNTTRHLKRIEEFPGKRRDLGLYNMANQGLDIESLEVKEGDTYRYYEIKLGGDNGSILKLSKALESMDSGIVIDKLSYEGQNESKYVIQLHFLN